MRILCAVILCLFPFIGKAQSFATGHRTISFSDVSRNRSIPSEIYYPAASAGDNVPLVPGTQQFPVVVFGHGFVIGTTSYRWLADSLASNGFITVLPNSESSLSPSHEQFGRDLAFLAAFIPTLNDSANSFLAGRVKNRSAVAGHSMGGGASFLATNYNFNIKAVFNFAAAETNPSAKAAALHTNIPALVFAGNRDCIVADSIQLRMYSNIPYPCKTYVNIDNALHCHFANNNGTCATGQLFSGCNSSPISAQLVFEKSMALIIPFLNYYLKDSCSNKNIFEQRLTSLSGITYQRTCSSDPFNCSSSSTYIFNGDGLWTDASMWENNLIPPSPLPAGSEIIINPAPNGVCTLNIQQLIGQGAKISIRSEKRFIVSGDLTIE